MPHSPIWQPLAKKHDRGLDQILALVASTDTGWVAECGGLKEPSWVLLATADAAARVKVTMSRHDGILCWKQGGEDALALQRGMQRRELQQPCKEWVSSLLRDGLGI